MLALVQVVLAAVQVEFEQHCCVLPPQVPQAPSAQVPAPTELGQASPFAMHAPSTQHPP